MTRAAAHRDDLPLAVLPDRRRVDVLGAPAVARRQPIEPLRPPQIARHASPLLVSDAKLQLRMLVPRLRAAGEGLELGVGGGGCERNTRIGGARACAQAARCNGQRRSVCAARNDAANGFETHCR